MLANRFSEEVRNYWVFHFTCLDCGRNTASQIHHIFSPVSHDYIKGKHNESLLNSCPLCIDCHIGKPMHGEKKQKYFLLKVKSILDSQGYKYNEKDYQFLKVYKKYYD